MEIDPNSLDNLRREAETIPPQRNPRAEANRQRLLDWIGDLDAQIDLDRREAEQIGRSGSASGVHR